MNLSKKEHWEKVFATKEQNEVSWFQPKPQTSIDFFVENSIPKDAKVNYQYSTRSERILTP